MLVFRNVMTWIAMSAMAILLVHDLSLKKVMPEVVAFSLFILLVVVVGFAAFAQIWVWVSRFIEFVDLPEFWKEWKKFEAQAELERYHH